MFLQLVGTGAVDEATLSLQKLEGPEREEARPAEATTVDLLDVGSLVARVLRDVRGWEPSQPELPQELGTQPPGLSSTMSSSGFTKSTIRHALWVLCWKEPCPGLGYPLLPEEQVNIARGRNLPAAQEWPQVLSTQEGRRTQGLSQERLGIRLPGLHPCPLPGPGRSGICAFCRVPVMREQGSLAAQVGSAVLPETYTAVSFRAFLVS